MCLGYSILMQGVVDKRKGWRKISDFNEIPHSTYDMWFSYKSDSRIAICIVLIPIPIPLGLIPILIPIWRINKINDSDSNSGSSSKWFQFWFRFQCFPKYLIPILIPIPVSFDFDSDSDSNKPGFDSDSDSRIWFRFRNHLQLWLCRTQPQQGLVCNFQIGTLSTPLPQGVHSTIHPPEAWRKKHSLG